MQFLASAIGKCIQQHVEFHYANDNMLQLLLTPISGVKSSETIHIMWVKFTPTSSSMDHICPLVPMDPAACNANKLSVAIILIKFLSTY